MREIAADLAGARAALVSSGCGYNDVSDREPVALDVRDPARVGVFVTLGQSQIANAGETLFAARRGALNLNPFDGKLYQARDPLLGCNEERGNFASRLGDLPVAGGRWFSRFSGARRGERYEASGGNARAASTMSVARAKS